MKFTRYEGKTALTPPEKLRVAVAVLLDGMQVHEVASLMGVNPGRVSEAVGVIWHAIEGVEEDHEVDMADIERRMRELAKNGE